MQKSKNERDLVEAALMQEYNRGFAFGAVEAVFYLEYDRDEARDHLEYVEACVGLPGETATAWALDMVYGPAENGGVA